VSAIAELRTVWFSWTTDSAIDTVRCAVVPIRTPRSGTEGIGLHSLWQAQNAI